MNFEHATQAIDTLVSALKNGEQNHILHDAKIAELKEENIRLNTILEHKGEELDKAITRLIDTDANLCTEIRRNGELAATLKQLLAEQMALASRAAEMLRSLEDKPKPTLSQLTLGDITREREELDDNELKKIDEYIARDVDDLRDVPVGQTFIIDPPDIKTNSKRAIRHWYRVTTGKGLPKNWMDGPGVEFRRERGGKTFLRYTAPAKEDREPLPFRPEAQPSIGTSTPTPDIIQTAFPPDDGQELPKFLTPAPASETDHGDQRREP
jgi:hypothetical protein